jgi:hypothetical protein
MVTPQGTRDNPWIPPVPMECQTGVGVINAAGGDGGPGVIQMHVGSLPGDIVYPGGGGEGNLAAAVKPHPHGYDNVDNKWVDQLLPSFGRFSTAQTRWISLGGATVAPDSSVPEPLTFLFAGTDPMTGDVLRQGNEVVELDPLLAPAAPLEQAGLPELDPDDPRTVLLDGAPLVGDDEIYLRNPSLLRRFRLTVGTDDFDVASAAYDEGEGTLTLTVASGGPELPTTGQVSLVPRYFAITTSGAEDYLPPSAGVRFEFQATRANALGQPDEENIVPGDAAPETGGWATDIETLNIPESAEFSFYRIRVTFDIQADGGSLSGNTPRPRVDFMRGPFRF